MKKFNTHIELLPNGDILIRRSGDGTVVPLDVKPELESLDVFLSGLRSATKSDDALVAALQRLIESNPVNTGKITIRSSLSPSNKSLEYSFEVS